MTEKTNSSSQDAYAIRELLRSLRLHYVRLESEVVKAVRDLLDEHGIIYEKEVVIAPRCRVDLLAGDGVAIEVKKGKPNSKTVAKQVARYAAGGKVKAVILVSERGLFHHITEAHGKPVLYIALSRNWGVTV